MAGATLLNLGYNLQAQEQADLLELYLTILRVLTNQIISRGKWTMIPSRGDGYIGLAGGAGVFA